MKFSRTALVATTLVALVASAAAQTVALRGNGGKDRHGATRGAEGTPPMLSVLDTDRPEPVSVRTRVRPTPIVENDDLAYLTSNDGTLSASGTRSAGDRPHIPGPVAFAVLVVGGLALFRRIARR